MYIVLQFASIWMIYEGDTASCRLLDKTEVDNITSQFPNIIGKGVLSILQFQKISPSRLMKMPGSGYVMVRVGEMWTLYEGGKPTPQMVGKTNMAGFSATFPKLIDQQMLNAIAIDTFPPQKLLSMAPLPSTATAPGAKSAATPVSEDRQAATGYKNSG